MSVDILFSEQTILWLSVPILLAVTSWASVALTIKFLPISLVDLANKLPFINPIDKNDKGSEIAHFFIKDILDPCVNKHQIYQQLGPEICTEEIVKRSQIHLDECIDDAFNEELPILWNNLPIVIKNQFYARAHRWVPYLVDNLLEDFEADINSMWQMDKHFAEVISQDKHFLKRFLDCFSDVYLQFQKYAIVYGSLFGLIHLYFLFYLFSDYHGILIILFSPLFLCLATYLALAHITKRLLKHPDQFDHEIISFLVEHFINPSQILSHLFNNPKQKRVAKLVRKHAQNILDGSFLKLVTQISDGPLNYFNLKQSFLSRVKILLEDSVIDPQFDSQQSENMTTYLTDRASLIQHSQREAIIRKAAIKVRRMLFPLSFFTGLGIGLLEYLLFFN